jgi:hypothetical protein
LDRRTSWVDNVVLFSYSDLQSFKVVVLVDMDLVMEQFLALANEVETLDGHVVVVGRAWYCKFGNAIVVIVRKPF